MNPAKGKAVLDFVSLEGENNLPPSANENVLPEMNPGRVWYRDALTEGSILLL